MTRILLALLAVVFVTCSAGADDSTERVQHLRAAMVARLAIMDGVAAYKWNNHLPVEDAAREAVVLRDTIARAVAEGVDERLATRAVEAQIVAARMVQESLFEAWRETGAGAFDEVPSLTDTLRPEIGRLTGALIAAIKSAGGDLSACDSWATLAPLPESLTRFPEAWAVAVSGVLGEGGACE